MLPSLLNRQIVRALQQFLLTGYEAGNAYFQGLLQRFVDEPERLTKGPYLSMGLPFLKSNLGTTFFKSFQTPHPPYLHQEQAWRLLAGDRAARSALVATGTGSGKTECFLYPILDHCARHRTQGIQAIVIYPMNALAADQARRLARFIHQRPELHGIRAGLFVGESEATPVTEMSAQAVITCKKTQRLDPPNILLTNYKMLDYLLIQPRNLSLWQHNGGTTLRYVVVDELHTFDGAQGTDLACLLRRLKGRLGIDDGVLICAGTSATMGSGTSARDQLRAYATGIFGETFGEDAVIAEQRLSVADFLDHRYDARAHDLPRLAAELNPDLFTSPAHYIAAAYTLLLRGDREAAPDPELVLDPAWRQRLGQRLKRNAFFKTILYAMGDTPAPYSYLVQVLANHFQPEAKPHVTALLDAVCALVAWARASDGSGPWLQLRMHLWLRECSRMVCRVSLRRGPDDPAPGLLFGHDVAADEAKRYLPLVQCRDCHYTAWLSLLPKGRNQLERELGPIYQAFFKHHPDSRLVIPLLDHEPPPQGTAGKEHRLCIDCARLQEQASVCAGCGHERLQRVWLPDLGRQVNRGGQTVTQSENRCAACGNRDALQIFGARTTSLAAVALGQAFATPYNDDRKLIAFSDGVQDASHRAVFLSARTWRGCVRAALAQALAAMARRPDLPQTLHGFGRYLADYWRDGRDNPTPMDRETLVATFFPPKIIWFEDYRLFLETGKIPKPEEGRRALDQVVVERLAYEAAEELGLRALRGRTLVRTGCAAMGPDPARLQAAALALRPKLHEDLGLRATSDQQCLWLLAGLLLRLQERGGICLPALDPYLANDAAVFVLNRDRVLPNYTDWHKTPSFLTAAPRHSRHSPLGGRTTRLWVQRVLTGHGHEPGAALQLWSEGVEDDITRHALTCLVDQGLLQERQYKHALWGLDPKGLLVCPEVVNLRTEHGRHQLWVPRALAALLEGMPSMLATDVAGRYHTTPSKPHWQAHTFLHGHIQRVFAQEHTGLLDRESREQLERDFIQRPHPWSTNLLSSTPTLEMGIDIGDLSSVILCSVPPRGANYQQRVGRAGRKDGNAFSLTLANNRAHDLFFYENPMDMIAGNVQTPGIFLNAVSVIQRQLVAYCFDRLVGLGTTADALPLRLRPVLDLIARRGRDTQILDHADTDRFPYNFLTYVRANAPQLLAGFQDLFGDQLSAETLAHLKTFFSFDGNGNSPICARLLGQLTELMEERKAREHQLKRLKGGITRTKKRPRDQAGDEVLAGMDIEAQALQAVIRDINQKPLLNFLTDEGLLPNYAFPEQGVKLRSIILIKGGAKGERKTLSFEYERPASGAVSELAPDNTFYAGGRKVRIKRVDLRDVEPWRLCARCNFSAREHEVNGRACPVCGDPRWCDVGRRRTMVRLRSVTAYTRDSESRFDDLHEEREFTFYTRQMLVTFQADDIQKAFMLHQGNTLFGAEYVRKVVLRDINFGESDPDIPASEVAGEERSRPGFRICADCAQVLPRSGEGEHAPFCRNAKDEKVLNCLYLYRELHSDAVRFLLPTGRPDQKSVFPSFTAALQLGLRLKFGGQVDHLRATEMREPVRNRQDLYRQFLVLYDTVPGGTGYVRHLMEGEVLQDILRRAHQHMRDCPCAGLEDKDGCYACLYAYRNEQREAVSRRVALRELGTLLQHWSLISAKGALSDTGAPTSYDSPLEELFPEKLRAFAASGLVAGERVRVRLVPGYYSGKNGFLLEVGERLYHMVMQKRLDVPDGLDSATVPDFYIYPAREDRRFRPLAVYLDGYAFHGKPEAFAADTRKRWALLQSGKYRVWTLGWNDLMMDHTKASVSAQNLFHKTAEGGQGALAGKLEEAWGLGARTRLRQESSMNQLLAFLRDPDPLSWQRLAFHGLLNWMDADCQSPLLAAQFKDEVQPLLPSALNQVWQSLPGPVIHGKAREDLPHSWCVMSAQAIQKPDPRLVLPVLWLDPGGGEHDQAAWEAYWRAANLLQFLPLFAMMQGDHARKGGYHRMVCGEAARLKDVPPPLSPQWRAALEEEADARLVADLTRLAQADFPPPVFGYELCSDSGVVTAEAEMAWPDQRVALLFPDLLAATRPVWLQARWRVIVLDEGSAWADALLEDA